ncbi:hypothetical protein ACKWTF_001556 [Chironomus riparius]
MSLIIVLSIFCFLLNFEIINAQLMSCSYRNDISREYICDLMIQNINGVNNFTRVSGAHLIDKNNDDVQQILRATGSKTINIPSIICETFQYATLINLQQLEIQKVDEYSFKSCKNLTYLNLKDNKITKINENSFSENLKLQTLSLQNNQLTTLPENLFINQQNLKELDLGTNRIKQLKIKWFQNLQNLNILLLDANQMEELPKDTFSSLTSLSSIWISSNNLKVIHSDSFGFLPNLTDVYLSQNQINAIDEGFTAYTGVQRLDMIGNLCANDFIEDNSSSIQLMRRALQTCFENHKVLHGEYVNWCKTIKPVHGNFWRKLLSYFSK